MSFSATLGVSACTCFVEFIIKVCLSASLMCAPQFARGAGRSCGVLLIRGSDAVGGVVCCAMARVAADSAAKANAARFMVHLVVYSGTYTPRSDRGYR